MTMRSGARRWLSNILLSAGIVMLGAVLAAEIERFVYQTRQMRGFDSEASAAAPALPIPDSPAPHNRRARRLESRGIDPMVIGKIEIPRIELAAMVREGVEAGTLRKAVGHVPGTALPGEHGNFVVAGHRDTFFRNLRLIRRGDEIRITTRAGAFTYYVDALSIVAPNDLQAVKPTPASVCTLVTCFPFDYLGPSPRRFIVRAIRDKLDTELHR